MTDELNARLARLRRKLAAATDPEDQADYRASIAALEKELTPAGTTQTFSGDSQTGVAIGGDANGDVQTGGERYQAMLQVFFQAAGVAQPDDEQRELLASYLDGLARRCDRMRLAGVVDWERKRGKAPAFTLSQLYVTLATTRHEVVDRADDEDTFADALAAGNPDEVLPQDARSLGRSEGMMRVPTAVGEKQFSLERPLLVARALSKHRQIVLLGGPGSGKSTFLRRLVVALATATSAASIGVPEWSAGQPLPVYASLGGFAAWASSKNHNIDTAALWQYVLAQSEGVALDGLSAQIKRAYRCGNLLLLLDGLDEVADPTLRARVATAVVGLGAGGMVVVTCRVRSYTGAVAETLDEWGESFELAPFSGGQIKHFVRGWYARGTEQGAIPTREATERSEELIERIGALPMLRELAATPLLLTVMTILHYYNGKLPKDRADLYEDMTQLLLTRWTAARREAGAPPSLLEQLAVPSMRDFHLRNVLEDLAYQAHQGSQSPDGRGLLEESKVRHELTKLFRQFDLDHGQAGAKTEQVLRYLEDESGLLLNEGGELYGLPHLTYEEYLAGCALIKRESKFQETAYANWQADPTRWREVVLLALGRMVLNDKRETAAQWLSYLLLPQRGSNDTERQRAALFAAECLLDIGGTPALIGVGAVDLPGLWQRLATLLADIIEGTSLPAKDRVRAGELLCLLELGDPRPGVCDLNMQMVTFTAATFLIGEAADRAQYEDEKNNTPVTIPGFAIARYPVTNAQFALFIADDGYNPQRDWWDDAGRAWLSRDDQNTKGLQSWQQRERKHSPEFWQYPRFGEVRPNHPVVGVSWYEASTFCRWLTQHLNDGYIYRLPSEAEWEYAARGAARRAYPWGPEEPDDERANFNQIYNGTTAISSFPTGATPEGLTDMAGNVWEWTASVYGDYAQGLASEWQSPADVANKRFTLRGGGWNNHPLYLRASNRDCNAPDGRDDFVGCRLARHLPENVKN